MADRNKILDMISKMSKLTSEVGAFEGEISAASSKIQELMEKYAISQIDIDNFRADQQEKEFKQVFESARSEHQHKTIQEWEWSLARVVASITMTRHYSSGIGAYRYGGSTKMVFFGVKENAAVAAELYALWRKNIWEMAKKAQAENSNSLYRKYRKDHPDVLHWVAENFPDENPRYFRSSWLRGCLHAMEMKVYDEKKAREGGRKESVDAQEQKTSSALVLYNAEVDKAYEAMSSGFKEVSNGGPKGWSSSGYRQGQETGSKIKIGSKQLED